VFVLEEVVVYNYFLVVSIQAVGMITYLTSDIKNKSILNAQVPSNSINKVLIVLVKLRSR
jgi:hypothetical protein